MNPGSETDSCQILPKNGEYFSTKQQQTLANQIRVKVTGDNNGGSGTLLAKLGNTDLVIANTHVTRGVNTIRLQTADGKTYPAEIVPKKNFDSFDLALLKFPINQNYCLADFSSVIPNAGMPVLAAGYSAEKGEAEAHNNRGLVYYDQKKWDLALTDYNKAIQLNPKYAEAYYNRGLVYSKEQKWDQALADYNKAIQINPQLTEAYIYRGLIYTN